MVKFSRWEFRDYSSWAFMVFKSYHTSLNRQYWSYQGTVDFLNKNVRISPNLVHDTLGIKEDYKRTISDEKDIWKGHFRDFENWTRLNAIMAASSYFEVYMTSIISTALESNPGIMHNADKKVDGVTILKYSDKYCYIDSANEMVIGDWSKRINSIKSAFGTIPQSFIDSHSELEKIRKLRNKIGHAFGRDIEESKRKGTIKTLESEGLSLNVLKKYLGIIYSCAKDFDQFLTSNHIGAYEEILFYHRLRPEFKSTESEPERIKRLKKLIGREGVLPIGKEYCKDLVNYYKGL